MVENALPDDPTPAELRATPLDALHRALGARMVPFAGWSMPLHYKSGIVAEHGHCRTQAALFDVSHMGQATLRGSAAASVLESLVPGDMVGLAQGRQRYTLLLNEAGGIRDDLMIARHGEDRYLLVVNASRQEDDFRHIAASIPESLRFEVLEGRALLALQGPKAAAVLARLSPEAAAMRFMDSRLLDLAGIPCVVSRSGYTGEDGFEIAFDGDRAVELAERLLASPKLPPPGSARATRCGSRLGCRCTGTTSTT